MLNPPLGSSTPPSPASLRTRPAPPQHEWPAGSPPPGAVPTVYPYSHPLPGTEAGSRERARHEDFGAAARATAVPDERAAERQPLLPRASTRPPQPGMRLTGSQQACLLELGSLARRGGYPELLARLAAMDSLERQALLTAPGQRQPLLHLLVERGQGGNFSRVLAQFLDLCPLAADTRDEEGCLALHRSASQAFLPALEVLARRTTDIDATDSRGQTALYRLCDAWLSLPPRQLHAGIECLMAARADWTIGVNGRDAARTCMADVHARNLLIGLPSYTRSLMETLQANPGMGRIDAQRLLSAGLARTPLDLIDAQRRLAGAPELYQQDPGNLNDRRLYEEWLRSRAR